MKRIITITIALVAISMLAVFLYGCGGMDENPTTTTTTETTTNATTEPITILDKQDGDVSDVSENANGGMMGDIADDVSEGVSEGVTDISRALTD